MRSEVSMEDLKKYRMQFSHQSIKADQYFNRLEMHLEKRFKQKIMGDYLYEHYYLCMHCQMIYNCYFRGFLT